MSRVEQVTAHKRLTASAQRRVLCFSTVGVTKECRTSIGVGSERSLGLKRLAAIALVLVTLPSVASADSFSANFAGTGLGSGVSGYNGNTYFSVFAGQLKWDAGVDDFLSFCLQLDSPLQYKQEFSSTMPGHISASEAGRISALVTQNFASITTNWMAAGLQLAIWNVLYDTDSSASSGAFYSSTSAATFWANTFLSGLASAQASVGTAVFLNSVPGDRGQDQVTYKTPEPGTLLLLGAGALALAARRRFTRRAN